MVGTGIEGEEQQQSPMTASNAGSARTALSANGKGEEELAANASGVSKADSRMTPTNSVGVGGGDGDGDDEHQKPTLMAEEQLSQHEEGAGILANHQQLTADTPTTPINIIKDDEGGGEDDDGDDEQQQQQLTGKAEERLAEEIARVDATPLTPPDLQEKEEVSTNCQSAPPMDQGSLHRQKEPSGTHISEELAKALPVEDHATMTDHAAAAMTPLLNNKEDNLVANCSNSLSSNNSDDHPSESRSIDATQPPSPPPLIEDEEAEIEATAAGSIGKASSDPTLTIHVPLHQKELSDLSPDKGYRPSPSAALNEASREQQSSTPTSQKSPSHATYAARLPPQTTPTPHRRQHPGRRSVTLRLLEEVAPPPQRHRPLSSPLISSVRNNLTSLRRLRGLGLSSRNLSSSSAFSSVARPRSGSDGGLAPLDEGTPSPTNGGGGGPRAVGKRWNANDAGNSDGGGSTIDRGTITVSWYEGTTSAEMQEHVFNCVLRKLNDGDGVVPRKRKEGGKVRLEDVRLLDESATPNVEVVLCPFLPDGSRFLLKFKTSVERPSPPPRANYPAPPYVSRAPDSPSAEPSPHPSPHPSQANLPSLDAANGANASGMRQHHQNAQQMQLLNTVAALLQQQQQQHQQTTRHDDPRQLNLNAAAAAATAASAVVRPSSHPEHVYQPGMPPIPTLELMDTAPRELPTTPMHSMEETLEGDQTPVASNATAGSSNAAAKRALGGLVTPKMKPIAEDSTTDQLIEEQLRQLNNLFAQRRSGVVAAPTSRGPPTTTGLASGIADDGNGRASDEQLMLRAYHRAEKKQVTLVIANYLMLFMGFIALSAEIQSRLPGWMEWVQQNYDSVQNCATDRDALIDCLSNGDFSGLVASFLLWATQSAAAKRIFLFGFDTPKKLWTVVYEALVTAVCWGTSYLFIRRGLNPNTRENFLHKYWKDAVYGSLAGFNAAFMKAVLKNLVPQDVALEALEGGRQWRIFRWLGSASLQSTVNPVSKEPT